MQLILRFRIVLFIILFPGLQAGYAQTQTIHGKVTNSITDKPLQNIKVKIKGVELAATTNSTGEYSIAVPDTITFIEFEDFDGMLLSEINRISSNSIDIYLSEIDLYKLSLEELMKVKVLGFSRFEQSASKTPNSIIVITERQIESSGYQDLSDVLKDIPGFDISDNAARFGEYYTLRGIQGNERILVLIDGHKINSPTGTLLSVGNSISIRFAKQIEIIYGSASAMYGADAYSGIINIISKDNGFDKSKTVFSTSYASLNSADIMFENRTKLNDNLSVTLFGRMFRSSGFDVDGTDTVYNIINRYQAPYKPDCEQPISDYNFFVRTDYKKFTLGYFRQMFNEGNALSHNPDKYVYSKENKWKSNTDMIWVTYKKEMARFGDFSADLNVISFKLDNNTQFTKWLNAYETDTAFSQYMTGSDLAIKGTTTLHKVVTDKFQFIVGVDYEHIISIPPYANDELFGNSYKYEGTKADSIRAFMTVKENRISGFGQVIWSPYKIIDIVLGGRFDYSSNYKGTFNPRVGLTFSPFAKTKLKFIYGSAFQAPSLFFQYEQFGTSTDVMLSTSEVKKTIDPSWELNNQLVRTYEFSVNQQIGKSFLLKSSIYYNHLTDIIQRVTFDNTGSTYNKYYNNLSNGVRNENVGVQEIIGFNTELNFVFSEHVETHAYYSFTDGESSTAGGNFDIPRISEHKIWIGATFSDLLKRFNVSPRLKWVSEMTNANLAAYPDGKQKGYTSLDLSISANKLFGFLKLYAAFNNLLNSKIEHGGLFQQSGVNLANIPQERLRIKFGIEVNFGK